MITIWFSGLVVGAVSLSTLNCRNYVVSTYHTDVPQYTH